MTREHMSFVGRMGKRVIFGIACFLSVLSASPAFAITGAANICSSTACDPANSPTGCVAGTTCVTDPRPPGLAILTNACESDIANRIVPSSPGRCLSPQQVTCLSDAACLARDIGMPSVPGASAPAKTCGYRCDDASGNAVPLPDRVLGCTTVGECTADCNTMCPRLVAGSRCHTAATPAADRVRCIDNTERRVATVDPPATAAPPAQGGATVRTSGGGSTRGTSATLNNPLGGVTDFRQLIARLIRAAIGLVGSIALAVFIYGGILYMTARGDANQVKTARAVLVQAFIGLMLIFFSYSIASAFLEAFVTTARMGSNVPITNTNTAP